MSRLVFPKPTVWIPKPRLWLGVGGYPCCADECPWCTGDIPAQIRANFAGILEGPWPGCGDCDTLNTAFFLDWIGRGGGTGPCRWEYVFPAPVCSVYGVKAWLGPGGGGYLECFFVGEFGAEIVHFFKDFGAATDCAAWNSVPLAYNRHGPWSCDPSTTPATCHITAA